MMHTRATQAALAYICLVLTSCQSSAVWSDLNPKKLNPITATKKKKRTRGIVAKLLGRPARMVTHVELPVAAGSIGLLPSAFLLKYAAETRVDEDFSQAQKYSLMAAAGSLLLASLDLQKGGLDYYARLKEAPDSPPKRRSWQIPLNLVRTAYSLAPLYALYREYCRQKDVLGYMKDQDVVRSIFVLLAPAALNGWRGIRNLLKSQTFRNVIRALDPQNWHMSHPQKPKRLILLKH